MLLIVPNLNYAAGEPTTADTTAPVLTTATGVKTGATTGAGSVTTDEGNGILYFVVTQSATTPSAAQIIAGQDELGAAADYSDSQAVSATGVQPVSASGLAGATTYYFHFVQNDDLLNTSNTITSGSFTTDVVTIGNMYIHRKRRRRVA